MPNLVNSSDSGKSLVREKGFESLLNQTFTTRILTQTSDSQGGFVNTWADGEEFEGRLSLRLSSIMEAERVIQGKPTLIATHKIYCETYPSVDVEDKLTNSDNRTFEVVSIQKPSDINSEDDPGAHYEIFVREVDVDV